MAQVDTLMAFAPKLDIWHLRVKGRTDLYYQPWAKTQAKRFDNYSIEFEEENALFHFHRYMAERDKDDPEIEIVHTKLAVTLVESNQPPVPEKFKLVERLRVHLYDMFKTKKRSSLYLESARWAIYRFYEGQRYVAFRDLQQHGFDVPSGMEDRIKVSGTARLIQDESTLTELRLIVEDTQFPKIIIDLDAL